MRGGRCLLSSRPCSPLFRWPVFSKAFAVRVLQYVLDVFTLVLAVSRHALGCTRPPSPERKINDNTCCSRCCNCYYRDEPKVLPLEPLLAGKPRVKACSAGSLLNKTGRPLYKELVFVSQ